MQNPGDSSVQRIPGYTGYDVTTRIFTTNDGQTTYDYPTITKVTAGSPADSAGLLAGDVILEANGKDTRVLWSMFPELGVKMTLRVRRNGDEKEVAITPIARPKKPR